MIREMYLLLYHISISTTTNTDDISIAKGILFRHGGFSIENIPLTRKALKCSRISIAS